MTIKIVRSWPLSQYVKFNMTAGEKLKAAWKGGIELVPFMTISFAIVSVGFLATGFLAFCEDNEGRRKYSNNLIVYRPDDPILKRIATTSKLDR